MEEAGSRQTTAAAWPRGTGEMARRIREFDWAATPLGPIDGWPQRLRTFVDLMLDSRQPVYIAWGPELTSLHNDAFIEILGTKHPCLGLPFAELWSEIWDEFHPLVEATLRGEAQHFIDRPLALQGREDRPLSWFTFSFTPLRDDIGAISGFYCAATDTTEHKQAQEAALAASEARYRTLFESIDEGFCVLEMLFDDAGAPVDYRFLEVNPAFARQTGLGNPVGRRMRELAPDLEADWYETYGHVAITGEPRRFVKQAAALGRWYNVYAFRFGEPHKRQVAVLFDDVTERRRAEERVRGAFRIRTVGVIVWGEGFLIKEANEAFLRMTGYTREEARTLTWQALTPPEFHEASLVAVQEIAERGETTPYEKQYFRKDGSRWWGLFAARRVDDEVVEFVLDVTQRRNAEAALRQADRRKDEFLATLAHELRNPLAPIRNGLQILRLTTRSDDVLRRTAEMMDRQLSHLVRLVDDLLDVGRLTAGKLELRSKPVKLAQAMASSVEATRSVIEAREHALVVDDSGDDPCVLGDFDRLAQVFMNLLTNAAKYTEPGGRIHVSLRSEGDEAVVRIADTGIGIPEGELDNVFELFSQVRAHQGQTEGGLGIGLALVRKLVTLQGGRVEAASAGLGRGSVFTVRLPLLKGMGAARSPQAAGSTAEAAHPRRIVVADDNPDAAASLAEILTLLGHEVWTAGDGVEALEKVEAVGPDIVFLDLGMPRLDGIEAARRIRQTPAGHDARLIALTGWGQEADRQRTREAGFDQHVIKPIDAPQLNAILGS